MANAHCTGPSPAGAPLGFIIANGLFLLINMALPHPDGRHAVGGLPQLGLAHPLPVLGGHGDHRQRFSARRIAGLRQAEQRCDPQVPLSDTVRYHWRELILGTFIMLATYVPSTS